MDTETHEPDFTIAQGRALVRAIEALDAVALTDPVAGPLADDLTAAYKRQLQAISEKAPHPAAEAVLKEQALVRSRRRCCVCHQFAGEDVNVYHIDPDFKDPPDTLENAIVLCLRCHAEAVYAGSQRVVDSKYSARELRKYRDLWWEWCEKHPDVTIPTSLPGIHGEHLYMPFPLPRTDTLPEPGPLPPGSRLPFPRNPFFTGRAEALDNLARTLLPQPQNPPAIVLITQAVGGVGGIGKSQLATEFAYRYGRFFSGVHWLNGAWLKNLDAEIARCGDEMDLPHWPEKQPEQVARTVDEWQAGGARLVILDNIEDESLDAVREWLSRLHGSRVRLLLTARRSDWPADMGLNLLPLDVFTPEESLTLLRQHLPPSRAPDGDLEQLAEQLGNLPLALHLAGRYLARHSHLPVTDYSRLLKIIWDSPSTEKWRENLGSLSQHDLRLAAVFALSWERVTSKIARRLLLLTAHCAPNCPIPPQILEEAAALETHTFHESIDILADFDLLHADEAGPIAHPALARLVRALPEAESALPSLTTALAWLTYAANTRMDRTNTPFCFVPLLPHVCAVLESAEKGQMGITEDLGTIYNSLGYYQDRVEDHAEARASFERALKIWQAIYGEISLQAATAHSNLGSALQGSGDLDEALASFERALAIDEAIFGPDHPDVARDLNNLGGVLEAVGDPRGAWSAYVCALAILEHVLGTDHPDVATQLGNVGVALEKLNDLAGAQAAFERALSIFERILRPGHPRIKAMRENLENLARYKDLAILPQRAMHPVHVDGSERYFVCPECGTVREELSKEDGAVAQIRYHELDDGTLSEVIVEKARTILRQLRARQPGHRAIERVTASWGARHPAPTAKSEEAQSAAGVDEETE